MSKHFLTLGAVSAQPVMDVTSNGLICNGVENPFQQPVSQDIITVPAGATVTAEWHHTLAGADPSDPADPVDPSHHGEPRYLGSYLCID